jgi:hypothetical protein
MIQSLCGQARPSFAACKKLFGIRRIAPSAKSPGQCELEVEQTVFATDRTETVSARTDFCGI